MPGGPVFITRALLSRLENEAQLAGVLGMRSDPGNRRRQRSAGLTLQADERGFAD